MAKDFGNEESLIPLIQGGMSDPNIADAGATGMAMIMQASTSVLSNKAREWDDNITRKVVTILGMEYAVFRQRTDQGRLRC